MASQFRRLLVKDFPKPEVQKESIEQTYWKEFKFPTVVKEFSAINHVDISPIFPYDALVTSSGKVQIFEQTTNTVRRTSSRSKESTYGARFRDDGKLMVTGGESGLVQILDTKSRAILRNLRGHTAPTRVCSFAKEQTKIFSASDDKTIRQWDLPTEKEIVTIKGGTDYIRCGCLYPKNSDQFVTGSYDHTVNIWDFRTKENQSVSSMDHGAPVESVLMHSYGGICISAGSNFVKVWDVVGGGRLLYQFSNHQKTVTSLCFDGQQKRLLSASLDRNVKIYNVHDYSVVATLNYPSPILAMDLSRDDMHLVIGMADGAISLQHRKENTQRKSSSGPLRANNNEYRKDFRPIYASAKPYSKIAQPGTLEYRMRNSETSKPKKDDVVVKGGLHRRKKFSKIDNCLRKFNYRESLVAGLKNTNDEVVVSLLTELDRRDALEISMSNQDKGTLKKFVAFLSRNLSNSQYSKMLVPVANLFLDLYSPMVVADLPFRKQIIKLRRKLRNDLEACEEMMRLLGAIEQVFTLMTPPPEPPTSTPTFKNNSSSNKEGGEEAADEAASSKEDDEEGKEWEKIRNKMVDEVMVEVENDNNSSDNTVDFEIKESSTEIVIED